MGADMVRRVTMRAAVLFLGALVVLALLVLQAGCARDATPKTYPVNGKVIYKGKQQPLAQGTVLFESVGEPKVQASGEIQPDGSFELASDLGKAGTVPGEHRVMIQPPFLETGQKPILHRRFTSYATSKLRVKVNAGGRNEVVLEVER